jgi:hypothetical protein
VVRLVGFLEVEAMKGRAEALPVLRPRGGMGTYGCVIVREYHIPVARSKKEVRGRCIFGEELDLAGSLRAVFSSGATLEVYVEYCPRGQENGIRIRRGYFDRVDVPLVNRFLLNHAIHKE